MDKLINYVLESTRVYRLRERVRREGGVTIVDDFPKTPESDDEELVNVFFVNVGFTPAADRLTPDEFYELVVNTVATRIGADREMTLDALHGGPSFIALGAWLGDQTTALRYMALGQHHGLWQVITPGVLGIVGEDADRMAGLGLVVTSGFDRPGVQGVV